MGKNDWELSSGLALDGCTGTITEVDFGYNANIGPDVICLNLTITPDDGEEDIEQSFSVGSQAETDKNGTELQGITKINKNTNMGILMQSVIEVLDEDELDDFGDPKVAASWLGQKFTWGSIEKETMNPSTKEKKLGTKFVVTEYHGLDDDTADGGKGGKKSSTKSGGKASKGSGDVDPKLWKKLVKLAGEHEEHDDFVAAALDISDVSESKAAQEVVMKTGKGTIWAEVHG